MEIEPDTQVQFGLRVYKQVGSIALSTDGLSPVQALYRGVSSAPDGLEPLLRFDDAHGIVYHLLLDDVIHILPM